MNNPGFDQWIKFVFHDYVRDQDSQFEKEPELTDNLLCEFLIHLFNNPKMLIEKYTLDVIGRGLDQLIDSGNLGHVGQVLGSAQVSLIEKQSLVRSSLSIFRNLFLLNCSGQLLHLSEQSPAKNKRLDAICYMWWDLFPIAEGFGNPQGSKLVDVILEVLEQILRLPSDSCIESALHGLGHYQSKREKQVTAIIDQFLKQTPNLRSDLVRYAQAARIGMVN